MQDGHIGGARAPLRVVWLYDLSDAGYRVRADAVLEGEEHDAG